MPRTPRPIAILGSQQNHPHQYLASKCETLFVLLKVKTPTHKMSTDLKMMVILYTQENKMTLLQQNLLLCN